MKEKTLFKNFEDKYPDTAWRRALLKACGDKNIKDTPKLLKLSNHDLINMLAHYKETEDKKETVIEVDPSTLKPGDKIKSIYYADKDEVLEVVPEGINYKDTVMVKTIAGKRTWIMRKGLSMVISVADAERLKHNALKHNASLNKVRVSA